MRRRVPAVALLMVAVLGLVGALAMPVSASPVYPDLEGTTAAATSIGAASRTGLLGAPTGHEPRDDATRSDCAGLSLPPRLPGVDTPRTSYEWQGRSQRREVYIPSRGSGSCLFATVFAPAGAATGRLPAVVIAPAGLSTQNEYQWAARDLAGHGYVAITVDPQGVGRSDLLAVPACRDGLLDCGDLDNLFPDSVLGSQAARVDAVRSGLDFLVSPANPFASRVDRHRLGAAGHSLSASAVSSAQDVDSRIRAIVAWDMLFARRYPPLSLDPCKTLLNLASRDAKPRVPALSLDSDGGRPFCITGDSSYQRWAGFDPWRAAGMPSMLVPIRGTDHMDFAQQADAGQIDLGLPATGTEAKLRVFAYYTRAWFDRYLAGDASATDRLMASRVVGHPRDALLSTWLPSAAYLPQDGIDCKDLAGC